MTTGTGKRILIFRIGLLAAMLAGILGPWIFDLIVVPAEYTCQYRLHGDYCGVPLPGAWILVMGGTELIRSIGMLITGTADWASTARVFIIGFLGLLLVLPIFSTLSLCLRPYRRRMAVFQIAACVLAAGVGLLVGINSYPRLFYVVWGVWLYMAGMITAAALEVVALRMLKTAVQVG
jgi:hypothetical protein